MSAEGVARKKHIRTGHKVSGTKMIAQIDTILSEDSLDVAKLSQLKLSVQEKLETIKTPDRELLDLVEEELTTEIEQTDGFKEGIYTAIINIYKCIAMVPTQTSVAPTGSHAPPITREATEACATTVQWRCD